MKHLDALFLSWYSASTIELLVFFGAACLVLNEILLVLTSCIVVWIYIS